MESQGSTRLTLGVAQGKSEALSRHSCRAVVRTFLMLPPFDMVPHVVSPTVRLFSLLLLICNFASVMNSDVNICVLQWS